MSFLGYPQKAKHIREFINQIVMALQSRVQSASNQLPNQKCTQNKINQQEKNILIKSRVLIGIKSSPDLNKTGKSFNLMCQPVSGMVPYAD